MVGSACCGFVDKPVAVSNLVWGVGWTVFKSVGDPRLHQLQKDLGGKVSDWLKKGKKPGGDLCLFFYISTKCLPAHSGAFYSCYKPPFYNQNVGSLDFLFEYFHLFCRWMSIKSISKAEEISSCIRNLKNKND